MNKENREAGTTETERHYPKEVTTIRNGLTIWYLSFATCQGAFRRDRLPPEGHLWGVPGYQKVVEGLRDEVEEVHPARQSWEEGREVHPGVHQKVPR